MGAIGLFDVQGGASADPRMQLSSPLFDKVTIQLNNNYYPGKTFKIINNNNSPANIYIQSAQFNGKKVDRPSLSFKEIVKGGTLEYTVGNQPNINWASDKK
jgi:putative alpha-1,2-mannosidase